VGHIGGEKNRGAVGADEVDSGQVEMLELLHINIWVREIASAEGAKLRLPRARSPLYWLGGLGERRKLPLRGLGRSHRNRRNFEHFMPKWSAFLDIVNLIFFNNQIEKL